MIEKKKKSQLPIATQRPGFRISCLSSPPKIRAQFCSHGKDESGASLKAWLSQKMMNALANAVRSARLVFSIWIHHTGALASAPPASAVGFAPGFPFTGMWSLGGKSCFPRSSETAVRKIYSSFEASMNEIFFSEHPGRPGKEQ